MAAIIGWAHTPFGKLEGQTPESLIQQVCTEAMADAEIEAGDVGHVYVGHFNGGLSDQDFTAGLVSLADPGLRHTPATRLENACATGSAAIHAALDAVDSGRIRCALVVGVETMTGQPTADVGRTLLRASYVEEEARVEGGFAGVFGQIAQAYFQAHGDQSAALAHIAAKNHANGALNPLAHVQKDLGFEFCNTVSERNPKVAGPLRRTDCSLISDGAAALVIGNDDMVWHAKHAIGFRARVQANDWMPLSKRDKTRLEGAERAWHQALSAARLTLDDLDFVETHDCFTIAELMEYEAMGLAARGRGADVVADGTTLPGGRLPVNPSGGLKAKGHPVGATGVSMHVMAARQLCGQPAGAKVPDARTAGIFNMGGTAVANYVSIVERVR